MDQLRLMPDNQLTGESAEAREEDQLTRESAETTFQQPALKTAEREAAEKAETTAASWRKEEPAEEFRARSRY